MGHDPRPLKFKSTRGKMNADLLILRMASKRRNALNERDGAGLRLWRSAQLRRSSDSVAAPSQQHYNLALNWSSSSCPSSGCCQQHLEEGPGGTSREDASCAQHELRRSSISSVAAASGRRQCPATMSGRRGEKHLRAAPRASLSSPSKYLPLFRALATATSNCRHS